MDAPASTELTTPAKSTQNATSAIDAAASQGLREASVPRQTSAAPASGERRLRLQPLAHRAAEVDEQQHRERAERRERGELGVVEHLDADREERRHDDRRASGPSQRRVTAVVGGEPVQRVRHVPSLGGDGSEQPGGLTSAPSERAYLAILSSTDTPPPGSDQRSPREELLERRLTRARFALGALGAFVAICVILVGATVWYWMSYLLGPSGTPFTRGPYLTRVTATDAALRWRVHGGKEVNLTATGPDGAAVDVARGVMGNLKPDTRYAWVASVDDTAHASGSFTTPPARLERPLRFAVLADYGSGDDNEWAVGRLLVAQQPEFAVTAGDNSYLVAAESLLDRNIFRPLGDLMRNAPMYVCVGDHDNFFPGPRRDRERVRPAVRRPLRASPRADPARDPRGQAERARGDRAGAQLAARSPVLRCAS